MHQVAQDSSRIRAKLLRSLCIIATILATFAAAKDIEYEQGAAAAVSRSSAQVVHVGLNTAGISCSVDSAYGPDFLWTRWFDSAVLDVDAAGASSLVLFDDEGGRDTRCAAEASIRVTGAIDVEFSRTAEGGQYLVHASGRSMGFVQISVREMIARILGATEAVTPR